ncbi:DUF2199 domain-containing protein [Nocardia transvalensis]|uniref:DUF2199 domain-containing protein n=1 Tax=Nocardia transvalensis TaxID=37333 RepID=UPI0018948FC0|nr:DUF2199 domain-containing protein [Nocardia transvalensis]MBF6333022.1 DUF2199 domain-containing protein [Nocardia transvalensis]
MSTGLGFLCSCCGERHDGLPFAYGIPAPAYWDGSMDGSPGNILGAENCVIGGEHFFIRARLILPVVGSENEFVWGVWVSLSESNYVRTTELWTSPERVHEPPCFGWLSVWLPGYEPTTLNLKARVHQQPVGMRPTVELEPTDHPLAVEQRTGITLARVQAIAELMMHPRQ